MITVYLIVLIINAIIIYLVRNSHSYREVEPIKFSLIIWVLYGVFMLIPIVNLIVTIICAIVVIKSYLEQDLILNDDFWLNQKY
jgi:hypothetical protein